MLWQLAIRTLLYDRGKLVAGLVGVIFSVVLVNIQGGLFSGLMGKASLLVDRSGCDIWVGNRGMHNVDFPHSIPARWINRVRSVPGVADAEPMRIAFADISLPNGKFEAVTLVGTKKNASIGRVFDIVEGPQEAVTFPNAIVVDQCDDRKLDHPEIGDTREIGGRRVRVAGKCNGILSFLVAPYIFTDYDLVPQLSKMDPDTDSYFLVKVDAGANLANVCDEIRRRLPKATVMPTSDYAATSVNFWMTRTGIGLSFGAATLMGLLVGLVMVGQTLYAMVLDRINEFATLKAIGSTEKEIVLLLVAQSSLVAIVGIAIGTAISMAAKSLLSTPRTEIAISPALYVGSATLVFIICLLASALPYLRVRRVDPHTVLQG